MQRTLRLSSRAAALVVAAAIGAGIALGGAAALGKLGEKTTIIREQAVASSPVQASFAQGKRLTINEIYRMAAPAVVQITSTTRVPQQDFFGNPFGTQVEQALGSGFVIDKAGYIVTNYHVVRGASSVQVSFSNDESEKAKIVGVDPSTDVALLKVNVPSRALKAPRSGTPTPFTSAIRSSRSAIRSVSTVRSRPESLAPCSARSRRRTGSGRTSRT